MCQKDEQCPLPLFHSELESNGVWGKALEVEEHKALVEVWGEFGGALEKYSSLGSAKGRSCS